MYSRHSGLKIPYHLNHDLRASFMAFAETAFKEPNNRLITAFFTQKSGALFAPKVHLRFLEQVRTQAPTGTWLKGYTSLAIWKAKFKQNSL